MTPLGPMACPSLTPPSTLSPISSRHYTSSPPKPSCPPLSKIQAPCPGAPRHWPPSVCSSSPFLVPAGGASVQLAPPPYTGGRIFLHLPGHGGCSAGATLLGDTPHPEAGAQAPSAVAPGPVMPTGGLTSSPPGTPCAPWPFRVPPGLLHGTEPQAHRVQCRLPRGWGLGLRVAPVSPTLP